MTTNITALREEAVRLRREHKWSEASDKYSELLRQETGDGEELSVEICKDWVDYGYCLMNEEGADLTLAWECLERAKQGYLSMKKEDRPKEGLADVYELLGDIGVKNRAYEEAAERYKIVTEMAVSENLSWRVGLNGYYMRAICLEAAEQIPEALKATEEGLEYIQSIKSKPENSEDLPLINEFEHSVLEKRDALKAKKK